MPQRTNTSRVVERGYALPRAANDNRRGGHLRTVPVARGYGFIPRERPSFGRNIPPKNGGYASGREGISPLTRAVRDLRVPGTIIGRIAVNQFVRLVEESYEAQYARERYQVVGSGWQLCGECPSPTLTFPAGGTPNIQKYNGAPAGAGVCGLATSCISGQALGAYDPIGAAVPAGTRAILIGWKYSGSNYKLLQTWTNPVAANPAAVVS